MTHSSERRLRSSGAVFFCLLENMADLQELYDELGRPSLTIFKRALRKRGLQASDEDLEFVNQQADRQLRAPPPAYRGKIFAPSLDSKWVADVMTIPPGRHALVVQDVFLDLYGSGRCDRRQIRSNR